MRVLHARDAPARHRVSPARTPHPTRSRGARGDREQSLPLHRLPVHRRRGARRRRRACRSRRRAPDEAPDRNRIRSADDADASASTRTDRMDRQVDPQGRGSASSCSGAAITSTTSSCPGMLHAAVAPQPLRARPHRRHRLPSGPSAARVSSRSSPASRRWSCATRCRTSVPLPTCIPGAAWRPTRSAIVGEPVAASSPTSRYIAEDALRPHRGRVRAARPAVVDPEAAMASDAPLVHEALGSNVAIDSTFGYGDVEAAFARGRLVVRDRLSWGRTGGQPLETVGAIAELRPGDRHDDHPLELGGPHELPVPAGANAIKIPANKLDLIRTRPAAASGRSSGRCGSTCSPGC